MVGGRQFVNSFKLFGIEKIRLAEIGENEKAAALLFMKPCEAWGRETGKFLRVGPCAVAVVEARQCVVFTELLDDERVVADGDS